MPLLIKSLQSKKNEPTRLLAREADTCQPQAVNPYLQPIAMRPGATYSRLVWSVELWSRRTWKGTSFFGMGGGCKTTDESAVIC